MTENCHCDHGCWIVFHGLYSQAPLMTDSVLFPPKTKQTNGHIDCSTQVFEMKSFSGYKWRIKWRLDTIHRWASIHREELNHSPLAVDSLWGSWNPCRECSFCSTSLVFFLQTKMSVCSWVLTLAVRSSRGNFPMQWVRSGFALGWPCSLQPFRWADAFSHYFYKSNK